MPWSVADVDSHKKGLSLEQKKKWVSVANSVLKKCLADGGTDATCAPKAIRVANSKFMEESSMKEPIKLTKGAMCFDQGPNSVKLSGTEEGQVKKLQMTAYSGKIIKGHWYWGDLAIDVTGLSMPKKVVPILHDHNTGEKIGYGSFKVNENHELVADETNFVDTPIAKEFIKLSAEGFPYEASIQARPMKIQRLDENEETEVNGFLMKGPGTVWRESVLRECSVTTFGADGNTKSVAMSENENIEVEVVQTKFKKEEVGNMKLEELKAAHPDLFAEIFALGKTEGVAEGKTASETSFAEEKKNLQKQISDLTATNESLTAKFSEQNDRILKLEKQETLRKEEGIKTSAETAFSEVMTIHDVPERLRPKIRKQINHESFIANEELDMAAFKSAIETELQDWLPKEGESDSSIMGMSFPKANSNTLGEDALVTRMLKHTGTATKQ